MAKLSVAIAAGETKAAKDSKEVLALTVPAGTEINITATLTELTSSDVFDAAAWEPFDGQVLTMTQSSARTDNTEVWTGSLAIGQTREGTIAVKIDDQSRLFAAVKVTVTDDPEAAAPGGPTTPRDVSEVSVGEWDADFAAWITLLGASLAGLVAVGGWHIARGIHLTASSSYVRKHQLVTGPYGVRVGAIIAILGLTVGAMVLILGACIGTLEVRGRLRKQLPQRDPENVPEGHSRGTVDLKDVPPVIQSLASMRATIAVVVSGALVVLCSLWLAATVVNAPDPSVETTTTTTEPTGTTGDTEPTGTTAPGATPGATPVAPAPTTSAAGG